MSLRSIFSFLYNHNNQSVSGWVQAILSSSEATSESRALNSKSITSRAAAAGKALRPKLYATDQWSYVTNRDGEREGAMSVRGGGHRGLHQRASATAEAQCPAGPMQIRQDRYSNFVIGTEAAFPPWPHGKPQGVCCARPRRI
ncbi:hypothetical protein MRX96_003701 [Rhipicephalus microplus]